MVALHREAITHQGSSIPIHHKMKQFVLVATLVVLVSGRPEPPSGYNYPRPGGNHHHYHHQISTGGNNFNGNGLTGGNFGFGNIGNNFQTVSSNQYQTFGTHGSHNLGGINNFGESSISSSNVGTNFGHSGQHFTSTGNNGVTVHKHVYVHVAPPEPEEFRQQQHISVGQAQKHYKIIFIKAPSPPTPSAASIALAAKNEEKTLVYVLVKKPDEQPEINIAAAAAAKPSKPEVYFIRYKAQKEHGTSHINTNINTVGNVGSTDFNAIGSNTDFTSTGISTGNIINTGNTINTGSTSLHTGTGVDTHYGPPGY